MRRLRRMAARAKGHDSGGHRTQFRLTAPRTGVKSSEVSDYRRQRLFAAAICTPISTSTIVGRRPDHHAAHGGIEAISAASKPERGDRTESGCGNAIVLVPPEG